LKHELLNLWQQSPRRRELSVFGYDNPNSTVRAVWLSACHAAKIKDFRFHDCRHTAITRMIEAGMPAAQVMKISGHTQHTTFQRYVNVTNETVTQLAQRLHEYNSRVA